ncbi:holdfast attachment protein HfaA [bacterium]|nr:holdfast attachment protein HfaA [bacterium]
MSPTVRMILSGSIGVAAGLGLIAGAVALLASPSYAQAARASGEFERPYGFGFGEESQPYDANTRDAYGNRVVVDGVIQTGADQSTLSFGLAGASQALSGSAYSGQAIGNQVNVITQGSFNTVVVTANQTNTGDQTSILNGRLNLQ